MATAAESFLIGRQRHLAGDFAAAEALYREVLERYPAHADTLAHLGVLRHQRGHLAEAEDLYRKALAQRPGDVDIHFKRGLALVDLGRLEEAADAFGEVARLRPDAAEPWNNLGNLAFDRGNWDDAIRCYREAVRRNPRYAEACLNLGKALRENDEVDEGLRWYREAVRLKPDSTKAHNDLAAALLETGALAEAESHFRDCLRLSPNMPKVLCSLAGNGLYRDSDLAPDELRARLADPALSAMDQSFLHSALGFLLDRAGAYDDAFSHLAEGNRIRREVAAREGERYDAEEHTRFIDRLMETFTPEYFRRVQGFGLESDIPVFVVGMPRSGSSLVEQILTQHPDVAGLGELRDIPRLAERLSARMGAIEQYPECVARLNGAMVQDLGGGYLARVRRLAGESVRVTDKMLDNFLHLGLIATLFPKARIIHCVRDPMDVCLSSFMQVFRGLPFTRDLGDLGRYYRDYKQLMGHWKHVLPLPMLDVVYEELVADPELVSRRLLEFCGLPWDERCLRPHENPRTVRTVSKLQVRRPISGGSVGRWRRYAAHLGPLREALGLPPVSDSE